MAKDAILMAWNSKVNSQTLSVNRKEAMVSIGDDMKCRKEVRWWRLDVWVWLSAGWDAAGGGKRWVLLVQ